ncbi:MAG: rhodanese-like domain-containing protein [Flavobacteriaceae bacterium]|nr:rhodanese-like domain-containing protein [Flavobacteriaceae bacterium]
MNKINISKLITSVLLLSILAVAIEGLSNIDFKSAKFKKSSTEVHEKLLTDDYLFEIENINLKDPLNTYVLVDLRSAFDFENGHLEGALNIFAPTLPDNTTIKLLRKIESEGKTIVIYSHTRQGASGCWCLLSKLGFKNVKILNARTTFNNNQFDIIPFSAEMLKYDIAAYIKKSNEVKMEPVTIEPLKTAIKKVTPVKKVKVEVEEGGC